MARNRPGKGGRRGGGRRPSSQSDQRRSDEAGNRQAGGNTAPGPSRMLLTKVLREGAIWNVYVATIPQSGTSNLTQLEFERSAEQKKLRYTRPAAEPLLDALHRGEPVSRASLQDELELAIRDAGADDGADTAERRDTDPSDPPDDPEPS